MALQAAFIFLSEEGNPTIHKSETNTESVRVSTFAVNSYDSACDLAKQLVQQNYTAIELCGGFGIEGVCLVKKAVQGQAAVGVVRFDHHPGLNHQSGDNIFI
ncbi:DUF6506 family protein [Neisseria sp. Ec49-e6-T10]|uniref:DUF6506 family protein n=1 Tax=Neisseria sp. Ec49-e6-T10 TaxID=3140744 RepID=UPI003EBB464A